jgi:hypothetical protein
VNKRLPLEAAMDMYEIGVEMREGRFRRDNPNATESQITAMMVEWRRWRPGAENGDAQGRAFNFQRPA